MGDLLTGKQRAALSALRAYMTAHLRAPTYAELADLLGARSATSAVRLVDQLERKGMVEVDPGTARGIRLTESSAVGERGDSAAAVGDRVVFAGVAPGGPTALGGGQDDGLWVDRHVLPDRTRKGDVGLVRIPDDAMAPAGIRIGDLVVGQPVSTEAVLSGDLVVCAISRRYTVRRLLRTGPTLDLVPDDTAWPIVRLNHSTPLGTVLALMRRY